MHIQVQSKSGVPIYEQIAKQFREKIIDKTLEAGQPLPSIRSLAAD